VAGHASHALPNLAQLSRDAFVVNEAESSVRRRVHRGDSDLIDLDLGEGAEPGGA
jgi:hypothetical protein